MEDEKDKFDGYVGMFVDTNYTKKVIDELIEKKMKICKSFKHDDRKKAFSGSHITLIHSNNVDRRTMVKNLFKKFNISDDTYTIHIDRVYYNENFIVASVDKIYNTNQEDIYSDVMDLKTFIGTSRPHITMYCYEGAPAYLSYTSIGTSRFVEVDIDLVSKVKWMLIQPRTKGKQRGGRRDRHIKTGDNRLKYMQNKHDYQNLIKFFM